MKRVWGFAANVALGFGGITIVLEALLGHSPEIIVVRACAVILATGLTGFIFRWWLEKWTLKHTPSPWETLVPAAKKDFPVPSGKPAVKS
jgi:hypothetical protein